MKEQKEMIFQGFKNNETELRLRATDRSTTGLSLLEMIVVLGIAGIMILISLTAWTLLFERMKLRQEISLLQTTIRQAYKDAISNEIYMVIDFYYFPDDVQRSDYYSVYWEKNGEFGYQEEQDEMIMTHVLPVRVKIVSTGGLLREKAVIVPAGLIKGAFDSEIFPGYAHVELLFKEYRAALRISRIGETKTKWL
ncbi:MAG: hypothetical protein A2Y62_04675 [Candidatus Fischerbacteria bacterium RBG_13_37_8]|uniref:Prepilin-type N-terminal cleavage/methylation domain-containing protein n=1 Tax=Candidatus Fischerbacteria bacterium RBG_13_37_8 TaxID=1817863 RepID=A0A1F5VQX6_9BACT|nr:MAG: hypothetical protein A2Y62_04675 [Candidatus Fischerbacteria bacterium RBG_13_37_8]